MGNMAFFRGGGYRRWLPPEIGSADEAVLVRRCWELLVLDSGGAARLAALGRAPLCRTVLMPQEAAGAWLRARQVVGCGLSPRCSLTLSGLSPDALAALRPLAKENAWAGVAANRIGDGYRDISAYEWSLTCRLLPETAFVAFPDCAHAEFVAGQPEAFAARLAETLERD